MSFVDDPFPGMNPFLEDFWPDVHSSLMVYLRNALQPLLPNGLFARVEESLTIDAEASDGRFNTIRADVLVAHGWRENPRAQASGGLAVTEHDDYYIVEREVERRVEIIDVRGGGDVVTVIEILSRTNKTNGSKAYIEKCNLLHEAGVNLVEIDLLGSGKHVVSVPPEEIPVPKRTPYLVCVTRGQSPTHIKVWHIGLLQRLPAIGIPLRPTDADAVIDLQPLLDAAYRDGRYDRLIDYRKPLTPPLPPAVIGKVEEYLRVLESERS
ncbi:MAG TPA: DUF4058 family protein [Chthoniobacteraceae bacterium]|jgi:hypothetical protein|nr:DUF4058 family protein [Chthoniobacteraceae bacterium]